MPFKFMAAARVAFALAISLAAGHSLAAGALAIDTLQGEKYGFSFNHPSADLAEKRALRECGADCGVVLRFRAECAAYAADQAKGSNAYGWGTGPTSASVQQRALSECREKGGSSCKVRSWGCDAIKESAQKEEPARKEPETAADTGLRMEGEWRVDYMSESSIPYSGTLRVNNRNSAGSYSGVLVLAFTSSAGEAKRVQQDVTIHVNRTTVIVRGSNPVYLQGKGNYSPDNYTLDIANPSLLRGQNSDAGGAGGSVTVRR